MLSFEPQVFETKPTQVEAIRWFRGCQTKGEWLKWCPSANIGTVGADYDEGLEETDFVWFMVNTPLGLLDVEPGNWVVKDPDGAFIVLTHTVFMKTYAPA